MVAQGTFPGRVVRIPFCVVGVLLLAPPIYFRRCQDASVGLRTLVTPNQGRPDENVVVGLDRWNLRTPVNFFFVITDQVKNSESLSLTFTVDWVTFARSEGTSWRRPCFYLEERRKHWLPHKQRVFFRRFFGNFVKWVRRKFWLS